MVKYLGSKRRLLSRIVGLADAFPGARRVADLFSGTSRVGHALKRAGYQVIACDHNAYAAALARCYVQADREEVERDARLVLAELSRLPGAPGYFTETFCLRSRYIHPSNGERIDAMRERLARLSLEPDLEAVVLVALMEAADRVDSTTGVQMAFLKRWAPRALNPIELRLPDILARAPAGKGLALHADVLDAAPDIDADIAYIDPPYNQHSYLGNYHVWESLVRWDKPEVYGVACKRTDCRERRSLFNSRVEHAPAMARLFESVRAPVLIVSFNDEGYLSRDDLERMLEGRGRVLVFENDSKRYVGAQIGIYNPRGEKVGRVGRLRNTEFLFVCASGRWASHIEDLVPDLVAPAP